MTEETACLEMTDQSNSKSTDLNSHSNAWLAFKQDTRVRCEHRACSSHLTHPQFDLCKYTYLLLKNDDLFSKPSQLK